MKKLPLLVLLALGLLATPGCIFFPSSETVLEPPPDFALPAATSTETLHQTIRIAVKTSDWTIVSEKPGEITVRLVRGHGPRAVEAKIFYTRSSYTITLAEAIDMDYDPVTKTISHKYNQWIRNLDQRISRALAQ